MAGEAYLGLKRMSVSKINAIYFLSFSEADFNFFKSRLPKLSCTQGMRLLSGGGGQKNGLRKKIATIVTF
jgi:hypothetical protein